MACLEEDDMFLRCGRKTVRGKDKQEGFIYITGNALKRTKRLLN